ncbi:MAG TPA: 50S ribosomal protein L4 [Candidatus Saccharimonadales bacterium]|nr:50S ribosomal protein L4 [Candidatus Saccharimonadales bacterium]
MANAVSYSAAGVKSGAKTALDKSVFGLEVKSHGLLRYAYQVFLDNGRVNLAKTKTRGEVIGSTKKPWRQKGTGRARFGSRYNPIWRGGGIIFGPRGVENYSKKFNTKAKKQAVRQALSLSAAEDRVKIIDDFASKDGKTKKSAALLNKIEAEGRVLLVVDKKDGQVLRSVNNLPNVDVSSPNYLNVYKIMNADTLVITKKSLGSISEWLSDKAKPQAKKAKKAE